MSGLDLAGVTAARDIVSSLEGSAAKGCAEDVLLEEAKRLFSFGVPSSDMVPHLSSKTRSLGIAFSKTELRRIVARAVAKESACYVTAPTTAAYIKDLADEIRSWEEGERFSFGIPALDDAALTVGSLSDLFTQDIEDPEDVAAIAASRSEAYPLPREAHQEAYAKARGDDDDPPATDNQRKAIFAVSRKAGMTDEELRALVVERYGKASTRELSKSEASELIERLDSTVRNVAKVAV